MGTYGRLLMNRRNCGAVQPLEGAEDTPFTGPEAWPAGAAADAGALVGTASVSRDTVAFGGRAGVFDSADLGAMRSPGRIIGPGARSSIGCGSRGRAALASGVWVVPIGRVFGTALPVVAVPPVGAA
jgi:hypothetical protein